MKRFIVLLSLVSFLFSASFDAEARKKFGSRSSGKTHQTQTTQQKQQTDTNTVANKTTTAPKTSSKKGIMAGVLGGLLAGGLIAAMLGDDFEGFQFLEMLLLAGAAFLIFKLVKSALARKQQPRFAGGPSHFETPQQRQAPQPINPSPVSNSGGFGGSSVPMNLPKDFDINGFLQGARQHYHTVQNAWNQSDFETLSEYLSPELVEEFKKERAQQGEVQTEVMFIDAELVRADTSPVVWEVSVQFRGKYRDLGDKQEEAIHEIWHLERKTTPDAPWLIVGVEDLAN
ncbi:Tim44 domain-containing protein (plasmid) [Pseudoalteromonas sp. T1lg65]|uniref:Tim44 domain-containing protein n=1 Tax=Pseudoalteromonas sp. T1lg65 TaxID=2077101 RepID=UPI003F798E03